MKVFTVGEDDVTKEIIRKVLLFCEIENIITELPARGGQLFSQINKYNKLSISNPVILLTDLDQYSCAPELLKSVFRDFSKNSNFIFNIAIEEAESWLMADRLNFSEYFKVNSELIPKPQEKIVKKKKQVEIIFPYKPSLYMMREIISKSSNSELKSQLTPKNGAKKGPEYNSALLPFIQKKWNIENAIINSDSLNRMINRIKKINTGDSVDGR